jgi:large subunit ribosomal protein L29
MPTAKELRAMTEVELQQKLRDAYQEQFNLRFRHAAKQVDNTARIRTVRRDIARIRSLMRQRELGVAQEGEAK